MLGASHHPLRGAAASSGMLPEISSRRCLSQEDCSQPRCTCTASIPAHLLLQLPPLWTWPQAEHVPALQPGFFDFVALPLLNSWVATCPGAIPMLEAAKLNREGWAALDAKAAEAAAGKAAEAAAASTAAAAAAAKADPAGECIYGEQACSAGSAPLACTLTPEARLSGTVHCWDQRDGSRVGHQAGVADSMMSL